MFQQIAVFALDDFKSANAAADVHPNRFRDIRCNLQARVLNREIAGGNRKVDEPPHLLDFFLVNELERIETLHLAGDPAVEQRGVELGNRTNTVSALDDSFPGLFRADPQGR